MAPRWETPRREAARWAPRRAEVGRLGTAISSSGWPSGLRRCVQVAVSPGGVGSNPTPDNSFFFSPFAPRVLSCGAAKPRRYGGRAEGSGGQGRHHRTAEPRGRGCREKRRRAENGRGRERRLRRGNALCLRFCSCRGRGAARGTAPVVAEMPGRGLRSRIRGGTEIVRNVAG